MVAGSNVRGDGCRWVHGRVGGNVHGDEGI